MADERQTYAEQVDAARLASNRGDRAEAERLLMAALETGERVFGAEHSSLATVLNELSKLYLRQSQHARAEEVLERLLRITKAKGAEHADVATALTGLALVKRAQGDDAAAEERFREALRIREHALAPEHMATVVTREQLSETCAARGNVSEAVTLLRRALPTREAALGAEHATVRALKARLADLELRALASKYAASEPEIDRWMQPDAAPEPAPAAPPPTSRPAAPESAIEPPRPIATAPRVLEVAGRERGQAASNARPARHSEPVRRSRTTRFAILAFAVVAAAALATVGLTARSRANAAGVHASTTTASAARPRADRTVPATNIVAPTNGAAANAGAASVGAASGSAASGSAANGTAASDTSMTVVQAGAPLMDSAARPSAPKLPRAPKNLPALTARLIASPNADSIVRASTKLDRAIPADQIGPGVLDSSRP